MDVKFIIYVLIFLKKDFFCNKNDKKYIDKNFFYNYK